MPPLPAAANVARVRVKMLQGGLHFSENVHHIQWASGAVATGDMTAMVNEFGHFYGGLFDGTMTGGTDYISEDTELVSVDATDLTSATGPYATQAYTIMGAASQVSLVQSCGLFSHAVHRRFRGGHGRTYLPGITPDNTTDGRTWDAAAVAALQTWWSTHFGSILSGGSYPYPNISGLSHVLLSYIDKAVNPVPPYYRTTPLTDTIVTTTFDKIIRSQRRRVRTTPTPS